MTQPLLFSALLLAGDVVGQRMPNAPKVFVDRGACPGECCTYGPWRAERSVAVYESPSAGSRVLGWVAAGTTVNAPTGLVRTKAGKFVVRKESPLHRPGDVIWVYTYMGEGYYRVWHAGEMVVQELSVTPDHQNPDDWGYYEIAPASDWWVQVTLTSGRKGWTNAPHHFSGTHSCG